MIIKKIIEFLTSWNSRLFIFFLNPKLLPFDNCALNEYCIYVGVIIMKASRNIVIKHEPAKLNIVENN